MTTRKEMHKIQFKNKNKLTLWIPKDVYIRHCKHVVVPKGRIYVTMTFSGSRVCFFSRFQHAKSTNKSVFHDVCIRSRGNGLSFPWRKIYILWELRLSSRGCIPWTIRNNTGNHLVKGFDQPISDQCSTYG